jgi:hypothetical protein
MSMVNCKKNQVFYYQYNAAGLAAGLADDPKYIIALDAASEHDRNIPVLIIRSYQKIWEAYLDSINVYHGPYVSYAPISDGMKYKIVKNIFTGTWKPN